MATVLISFSRLFSRYQYLYELNFQARINIFLNKKENEIESARIDRLIYGSITSANFSTTIPEVEIRYEQSIRRKGDSGENQHPCGDAQMINFRRIWFRGRRFCAARR